MKKERIKISSIKKLKREIDLLNQRVHDLENKPDPLRVIGPGSGKCGLCGQKPCICAQSQQKFKDYLKRGMRPRVVRRSTASKN